MNASQAYQLQMDTSANFDSPLLLSATQAYMDRADGNTDTKRALSDLRFGTTLPLARASLRNGRHRHGARPGPLLQAMW